MKSSLGSYQQYENLVHIAGGSSLNITLSGGTGVLTIPTGVSIVQIQAMLPTNTTYVVHFLPADTSAAAAALTCLTAEMHILKDQTTDIPVDWRKGKFIGWRVTTSACTVAGNANGGADEYIKVTLLGPRT
jgi:hypothetical protein